MNNVEEQTDNHLLNNEINQNTNVEKFKNISNEELVDLVIKIRELDDELIDVLNEKDGK